MKKYGLILFSLLLLCGHAFAANENPAIAQAPTAMIAKVLAGLFFVLVLIALFAWAAKKLGYPGMLSQKDQMKVLSSLPVGSREKAVLIEVAGKQLLLGVAPGRVNCLHVFPHNSADSIASSNLDDHTSSPLLAAASDNPKAQEVMASQPGQEQTNRVKTQEFASSLKKLLASAQGQ